MTAERRRAEDLDIESRLSTLEEQRRSDAQRLLEYHTINQTAIAGLEKQISLSNSKMDVMLEAIHMAKGGWWAAGKLIALILGMLSGLSALATGVWWALQHISFKPSVAAVLVVFLSGSAV